MKVFIYSEKGKGKEICEDVAFAAGQVFSDSYYESEIGEVGVVALADGVGGYLGGDIASRYVMERLKEISCNVLTAQEVRSSILDINRGLLKEASALQGKENMATTLTGVVMTEDMGYIFHVGNTRIYSLQGSYLKQMTQDHTTYQRLMAMGYIEGANACNKNEIIYCLGGGTDRYAEGLNVEQENAVKIGRRMLLTTDGIHEYIDIEELETFILGELDESTMQRLTEKASANGSADDKTILVLDRI